MIDLGTGKRVVGIKQTKQALSDGVVRSVLIAQDAEERIVAPLVELCERSSVAVTYVDSMKELGSACGIDVGAAVVALI